jgi:hypothetical protein
LGIQGVVKVNAMHGNSYRRDLSHSLRYPMPESHEFFF